MDTYDFASKHLYRQRRESSIDRLCSAGKFRDRKVAYLDTAEALDTLAYLRRGYRAKNLWAINNNPAEVARLTTKLKSLGLPTVNTVGLDFEDALNRRIPPDINIIDFDGMSCLHDNLVTMLSRIVASRPEAVYGITILGGRESKNNASDRFNCYGPGKLAERVGEESPDLLDNSFLALFKVIEKEKVPTSFGTNVNSSHERRLRDLISAITSTNDDRPSCIAHISRVIWDVYISTSKQPMVWCVIKSSPHKTISANDAVGLRRLASGYAAPFCKLSEAFNFRSQYIYDHGKGYLPKDVLDDLTIVSEKING